MRFKIHVTIAKAFAGDVARGTLRGAARAALNHESAPAPGELTIAVTDDRALRSLNRDYLSRDVPTDVLAFPSSEVNPETGAHYLGDIAISCPRAQAQARQGGHPLSAEVQLLAVHGVLHLLGHDHARPEEKARMWAAQAEILRHLKAPITGPAATHRRRARRMNKNR